jgi:hypothetical protein
MPPVCTEHTESWVFGLLRVADALLLVFDVLGDPLGDIEATRALLVERSKVALLRTGETPPETPPILGKPTILVATRCDLPGADDALSVVSELFPGFPLIGVGAGTEGAAAIPKAIFELLRLVRVYAKSPGKEADLSKPFVLHRGDTLLDFAAGVHKDFTEKLKFARVWGKGKFDGQRIQRDYELQDGDVIELHGG